VQAQDDWAGMTLQCPNCNAPLLIGGFGGYGQLHGGRLQPAQTGAPLWLWVVAGISAVMLVFILAAGLLLALMVNREPAVAAAPVTQLGPITMTELPDSEDTTHVEDPFPAGVAPASLDDGEDGWLPVAGSGTADGMDADDADKAPKATLSEGVMLLTSSIDSSTSIAGRKKVKDSNHVVEEFSWTCELLPHLGYQSLYDKIVWEEKWHSSKNSPVATTVIPQFQNPADNRKVWDGYPFQNAALTHFTGISGIEESRNEVAASLPRSDPKAGVFGYDRIAAPSEITDGLSNTLLIAGSGELAAPWIAGGGGTVRGARQPYFDSLTGFGSRSAAGKSSSGAIAVLADGSVRFVSSAIDPKVFRSMCTIHGNEQVDIKLHSGKLQPYTP